MAGLNSKLHVSLCGSYNCVIQRALQASLNTMHRLTAYLNSSLNGSKLLLKKYTWLVLAIGITQSAVSWAQIDSPAPLLADTLNLWQQNCAAPTGQSLSVQSIDQLHEFYQTVNYTRVWQDAALRQQFADLLRDSRYDGLEPAMYQLNRVTALQQAPTTQLHACDEVLLSHGYLQVLKHLRDGVLDPNEVEPYWFEDAVEPLSQPSIVTTAVLGLADLPQVFADVRPQNTTYQKLREVLNNSYLLSQVDWGVVPTAGKSIRQGAVDARVPRLKQRLQMAGYQVETDSTEPEIFFSDNIAEQTLVVDPLLYTDQLMAAVKAFQQDHYLESDGIVGPATLRELNISPEQRLLQVKVNLERLRWLDKLFDPTMLVVDIAGARLLYFRDGDVVWRTRTQVGTVHRKTPLLKSRITHLTINPTWTVPPTILREDKLPAIRRDIGYLARSNMSVLDYQGNVLNPYTVNWQAPSGIMLRQGPGPSNALGLVAIRFANPFTVFLHDTPSQHLFGRATRTVSSGCVRVEDAQKLVDHLLFTASPQERERIEQIQASGKTRNVNLPQPIPVLLAYWTVEVDMDNRLRFRSDNYGHDAKIAAALQAAQR